MTRERFAGSLAEGLAQVLEDAAFLFTEPMPEPLPAARWPSEVVTARLRFVGPVCGTMALRAPLSLCSVAAEDMTGQDADAGAGAEVLGELLNMAAGVTLAGVFGPDDAWELGVPEVRVGAPAEVGDAQGADVWVGLLSDDGDPIEAAAWLEAGRA